MVELFRSSQQNKKLRLWPERKTETLEMTCTGTLIEDLMATVERAERRARSYEAVNHPMLDDSLRMNGLSMNSLNMNSLNMNSLNIEPWITSSHAEPDFESKFLGVA